MMLPLIRSSFPKMGRPEGAHAQLPYDRNAATARRPTALSPASVCVALLLAAVPAAGNEPERFDPVAPEDVGLSATALEELASKVDAYLEDGQIVGAELLVVKDRRTVLHRAFGMKDLDRNLPMETDTLFNIRSMTKPLTGAALQILIDEGRVALDDPVAKFLPAFDTDASREITIDQVLTHRGGLPLTVVLNIKQYESLQEQAGAAGKRGPQFDPGEKFWYSDAGTDVVGAVVEAIAGVKLDDFWAQRIFKPLGMTDTFVANDPEDPRWSRLATIYLGQPGKWNAFWTPERESFYRFAWGSQSLSSSTRDYARFLAMWMDEGQVGDRQVLSPEAVARTLAPISELSTMASDRRMPTGFSGRDTFYGRMAQLWMNPDEEKPEIIGHSGSDGTFAWAWPEHDLMVLYFTQSRGGRSGLNLERWIDDLLLGGSESLDQEKYQELISSVTGEYQADFGSLRNTKLRVFEQGGNLSVDLGRGVMELRPPDENGRWAFAYSAGTAISFDRDAEGKVYALRLNEGSWSMQAPRIGAELPMDEDPADFARYLGTFLIRDKEEVIVVKVDRHRLTLDKSDLAARRPLDLFHLLAEDEQGFRTYLANDRLRARFIEEEDGRITGLEIYEGENLAAVADRVDDASDPGDDG